MEADLDHDGKISFEEFTKMVENTDVSMSMTLGAFSWSTSRDHHVLTVKSQINSSGLRRYPPRYPEFEAYA